MILLSKSLTTLLKIDSTDSLINTLILKIETFPINSLKFQVLNQDNISFPITYEITFFLYYIFP